MNRVVSIFIVLPIVVAASLRAQTPLSIQITQTSALIDRLNLSHADIIDRARAWRRLAALQQDAALYSNSATSFTQAIALFCNAPDATSELAEAIDGIGTLELETGQLGAAEASLKQARAMRLAANDTLGVARSDVHFANLYLGEHKYEQSHALAVRALAGFEQNPHADTLDKSSAMIAMSLALCSENHCSEAVPTLETLVGLTRRNYADNSLPVGFAFFLLGYADRKNHDLALADVYMKRGIDGMKESMGWGHPMFVQALLQYSRLLRETGRADAAREVEAKASKLKDGNGGRVSGGTFDLASLP
jgi:tetratricopeptide (TPR) repeat protein